MKHPKRKGPSNNKTKKGTPKKAPAPPATKTPSIEDCLEAGDAAVASMEGDKALACYASAEQLLQQALLVETANNTRREQLVYVLEKLGEGKASLGDVEGARAHFQQALQVVQQQQTLTSQQQDPKTMVQYHESLAGLYLYLGQLSSEWEALEVHKKGLQSLELCVELCQKEQQQSNDDINSSESMNLDHQKEAQAALYRARQKLGQAYATVAELYLTDLCFEDNAETECESYVNAALKITDTTDGEPFIDALQTAASLRLSQSRKEEAMKYILRVYDKMKTGCESLAKLVGLQEETSKRAVELDEVDAADNLPSFDFRCQTAKLLLECAAKDDTTDQVVNNTASSASSKSNNNHHPKPNDEKARCNRAAIQVLASLLAENDEVPECFYLLGCAFQATDNFDLASYYWTKALEMLTTIQKDLEKQAEEMAGDGMQDDDDDDDDDEIEAQLQSISCQIEEIQSKMEEIEEKEEAMEE